MDRKDIDLAIARVLQRIDGTLAQPGTGFPHYADPADGMWQRTPTGDWTGGFWCGLLWLAALRTGEARYRESAAEWAARLGPRAKSKSVFKGFLFWYGAGLGVKFFDDPSAQELCQRGVNGLVEMYNPAAGLIPLGSEAEEASKVGANEANIDALPGTVALLLGDGDDSGAFRFGLSHIRKHIGLCVRADGSVCQSATFDPGTGNLVERYTHKGFHSNSTWARAQAWAMVGLAQAIARGADEFRPVAVQVADWWIEHAPKDRIAYWDFDDTAIPDTNRDTSASAIAAASLLKLAELVPERREVYRKVAEETVAALTSRYLTPVPAAISGRTTVVTDGAASLRIDVPDTRPAGILTQGCFNKRNGVATEHELIWGDYFLFEALLALSGDLAPEQI